MLDGCCPYVICGVGEFFNDGLGDLFDDRQV